VGVRGGRRFGRTRSDGASVGYFFVIYFSGGHVESKSVKGIPIDRHELGHGRCLRDHVCDAITCTIPSCSVKSHANVILKYQASKQTVVRTNQMQCKNLIVPRLPCSIIAHASSRLIPHPQLKTPVLQRPTPNERVFASPGDHHSPLKAEPHIPPRWYTTPGSKTGSR
jgi:hypothetical protein